MIYFDTSTPIINTEARYGFENRFHRKQNIIFLKALKKYHTNFKKYKY